MYVEKPIKIKGFKIDRCKCIEDCNVYNSDTYYRKDSTYICEYHPLGVHGIYYKVYVNDLLSYNINKIIFNKHFVIQKVKKKKKSLTLKSNEIRKRTTNIPRISS